MLLRRHFNNIFLVLVILFTPLFSYAGGSFTVSSGPTDFKLHPGEDGSFNITLKNLMPRRFTSIYVFVGNDSVLDNSVEIPRYIELKPNENRVVKGVLNINRLAKTGQYGADIAFVEAMDEAGARRVMDSADKLHLNVEVYNDAIKRLQINSFLPDKNFYLTSSVSLGLDMENVGDTTSYPRGKIQVYDDAGQILVEHSIMEDGPVLNPKDKKHFDIKLDEIKNAGNFNAIVSMIYDGGTTTESTTITILPVRKIGLIFLASFALLLVMLNSYYKTYESEGSL